MEGVVESMNTKQPFSEFANAYKVSGNEYRVFYDILIDARGYTHLTVTSSANYFWVYPYSIDGGKGTTPLGDRNQTTYDITDHDFVLFYIECATSNNNGFANNGYTVA